MTLPTKAVVEWNDRVAVGQGDTVRVDEDGLTRQAVVVELIDEFRIVVRVASPPSTLSTLGRCWWPGSEHIGGIRPLPGWSCPSEWHPGGMRLLWTRPNKA
jgi:hypothetical protein